MAHPFFDSPTYPFDRPDAKAFLEKMLQKYSTVALIRAIFLRTGSPNWTSIILSEQAPKHVWEQVVQVLCIDGLFGTLCGEIMADLTETSPLRAAVQAVIDATDAGASVLLNKPKLVLSDRLFILDRESVRQKLALLSDNTAREKILLIRGGKKSGKSHLRFLVEEEAKRVGASFLYLVAGQVNNARETIEQIFGHFRRIDDIPPVESTPNAWFRKVALKLVAIADPAPTPGAAPRPLWIAMDNLGLDGDGQSILPTEVRQFFDQFALNLHNENFHRCFRLILIDYPSTEPTGWTEEVWTTPDVPIQEVDIQAQHVADCLRDWAASQNRVIPPDDLTRRSNSMIQTIDTQQSQAGQVLAPRLRRIHDELKRTIGELKAQSVA